MLFILQFAIVLLCILVGAQVGGIGLGVFGGLGVAVLTFGFGLQPTNPPIDVMLMIMAVVSAAAAMQAAGGLDFIICCAGLVLLLGFIIFQAAGALFSGCLKFFYDTE